MAKRRKRTPYQKIIEAAKAFKGVNLTPKDVDILFLDEAISSKARLHDEEEAARNLLAGKTEPH